MIWYIPIFTSIADKIVKILLFTIIEENKHVWGTEASGCYNVHSAYNMGMSQFNTY